MAPTTQVLEMLEKGETPPGIRADINDAPPNPDAPQPSARLPRRPKPWESTPSQPPSPAPNSARTPLASCSSTSAADPGMQLSNIAHTSAPLMHR
jgi:hypothetical protein